MAPVLSAVIVFILLPIAGLAMGKAGRKLKRTSFEGQTQWGVLMSTIEETLGGLPGRLWAGV